MKLCCAAGCRNKQEECPDLKFYRIPAEKDRRDRWIAAIRRENWTPSRSARLCSEHFISGKKINDPLSPDYVPSIFKHTPSPRKRAAHATQASRERRVSSKKRRIATTKRNDAASVLLLLSTHQEQPQTSASLSITAPEQGTSDELELTVSEASTSASTQTELTSAYLGNVLDELQTLRTDYMNLKTKLDRSSFSVASFEGNDTRVSSMTGLPTFTVLMAIFGFIKDHIQGRSVDPFTAFIIVLMRLKHAATFQYTASLFNVSVPTISRIFSEVIDVMFSRLVPVLVFWPERDQILLTLPMAFRRLHRNCVCIIDCFEIFCERPSDLKARCQTYSHYECHSTVKYLISVTPNGFISFISKGWDGRSSDKQMTEHCGFLNKLLPQDLVLADRRFDIADSVGLMGAQLAIPAFTTGKTQLGAIEVEKTTEIASVRIHVERVIGKLRTTYAILRDIIPVTLLQPGGSGYTTLDKMIFVCCALCNASQEIVPSVY